MKEGQSKIFRKFKLPYFEVVGPELHEFRLYKQMGFPGGSEGKASVCNVGGPGLTPASGRSPGKGSGNPLQYSRLENPMDGGAW